LEITLTKPAIIPEATWQHLHESLQKVIKRALALFA
jgi:hypothetical protein